MGIYHSHSEKSSIIFFLAFHDFLKKTKFMMEKSIMAVKQ